MSTSATTATLRSTVPHGIVLWALDDRSHDQGLEHSHHWAREGSTIGSTGPIATNTAAWPTPSSAIHDDVHYGAD